MARADIRLRGRDYSLACAPGQEARLKDLATRLDARLNEIEAAVGQVGDQRLMLIAALALLDELENVSSEAAASVDLSLANVNTALDEAAKRLLALAVKVEGNL
ncbi:MAG: cell division protein ZapA [Henriciella sp.]